MAIACLHLMHIVGHCWSILAADIILYKLSYNVNIVKSDISLVKTKDRQIPATHDLK